MLSLRRPSPERVETYRRERIAMVPTHPSTASNNDGYTHDRATQDLGRGDEVFERACTGLRHWVAHRNAGVEIRPATAELAEGATVAILTRQLGIWVLAACRIETVVDGPEAFGFTYATLPDHPERGYESFNVRQSPDRVFFEIEAISRPDSRLIRLGKPVSRAVQQRATRRYLDGLKRHVVIGA